MDISHKLSNFKYSFDFCKRNAPSVIIASIISIPVSVLLALIALYMPSFILNSICNYKKISNIIILIVGILGFKLLVELADNIKTLLYNTGVRKLKCAKDLQSSEIIMNMEYQLTEDSGLLSVLTPNKNFSTVIPFLLFQNAFDLLISVLNFLIYGSTIMTLALIGNGSFIPVTVYVCWLLLSVLINNYFINRFREEKLKAHRENREYLRKIDYICRNSADFTAAKDIRIYSISDLFMSKGKRYISDLSLKINNLENRNIKTVWIAATFFNAIRDIVAYVYLVLNTYSGNIMAAEFILYFSAITGFSSMVDGAYMVIQKFKDSSAHLNEWRLAEEKAKCKNNGQLKLSENTFKIEFRNVSFRYPNAEKCALSNISFKINCGEKLAIVGVNGAGKTTLVKLMCGLYQPTDGIIPVNDKPIDEYNKAEYFNAISVVFQKFVVLPVTVAENVASTSSKNIDRGRVKACLELAGLLDKINSFPLGIDTQLVREVNNNAIDLSGGETQKLMLAKALYKNSQFLVLDEPTSAMDPISENNIYLEYDKLTAKHTSVFISHRLSSTRFCDRILLIESGRILEVGTHDELMLKDGLYRKMFETQKQYYSGDTLEKNI